MITATVNVDLRGLYKYHDTIIEGLARFVGDLAEEGKDDIKGAWSPISPSSPGEPPAIDTGHLNASMEADLSQTKSFLATLRSNASYSADLEFGTRKMAARPFMRRWATAQDGNAIADKFMSGGYIK